MKNINASIVLYNTDINYLNRCLRSMDSSLNINLVTLIDNSETKLDLTSLYKPKLLEIKYLYNNKNLGYGRAHNIAIKNSLNTDTIFYHLVINADVFFDNNVVDSCFEFMEKNKDIGNVVPNILYPDGTQQYPARLIPGPFDLIFRFVIPIMPKFINNIHKKSFALSEFYKTKKNFSAPFLSGCFMFLRTATIKEIGAFDERFFLYLEDVDLSRRIAFHSKQMLLSSQTIFHEHGKAYVKSLAIFRIMFLNMIRYFNKWGWINDKIRTKINFETLSQ